MCRSGEFFWFWERFYEGSYRKRSWIVVCRQVLRVKKCQCKSREFVVYIWSSGMKVYRFSLRSQGIEEQKNILKVSIILYVIKKQVERI